MNSAIVTLKELSEANNKGWKVKVISHSHQKTLILDVHVGFPETKNLHVRLTEEFQASLSSRSVPHMSRLLFEETILIVTNLV